MYRYFEGYEDAMSLSCDVVDEVEELIHDLRYGKPYTEVIEQLDRVGRMVTKVKQYVVDGKGNKID
jgi:hypothetical protein